MSRTNYSSGYGIRAGHKSYGQKQRRINHTEDSFRCCHCNMIMGRNPSMGTAHRNHCTLCLWSMHVDIRQGDRKSSCYGRMTPIGLTYKNAGFDKYGNRRIGDIMLIHKCQKCGDYNINRIAADDTCAEIIDVYKRSLSLTESMRNDLQREDIYLLGPEDSENLRISLFGRSSRIDL